MRSAITSLLCASSSTTYVNCLSPRSEAMRCSMMPAVQSTAQSPAAAAACAPCGPGNVNGNMNHKIRNTKYTWNRTEGLSCFHLSLATRSATEMAATLRGWVQTVLTAAPCLAATASAQQDRGHLAHFHSDARSNGWDFDSIVIFQLFGLDFEYNRCGFDRTSAHLCRLAAASLPGDHDHLVAAHRRQQLLPHPASSRRQMAAILGSILSLCAASLASSPSSWALAPPAVKALGGRG